MGLKETLGAVIIILDELLSPHSHMLHLEEDTSGEKSHVASKEPLERCRFLFSLVMIFWL